MDLLAIGLAIWAYVLSRRPGAPRWLRFVPAGLAVSFVGSLTLTLWGLRSSFTAVADVSPQDKARFLSEGIARAMWWTAAGLGVDVVVLVLLIVTTVRLRRAAHVSP